MLLQEHDKHDDVKGQAMVCDVYDTDGHNLQRLISRGLLNLPGDLAKVPDHSHFGKRDDDDLACRNFGDGRINAYKSAPENSLRHSSTATANHWNF